MQKAREELMLKKHRRNGTIVEEPSNLTSDRSQGHSRGESAAAAEGDEIKEEDRFLIRY